MIIEKILVDHVTKSNIDVRLICVYISYFKQIKDYGSHCRLQFDSKHFGKIL